MRTAGVRVEFGNFSAFPSLQDVVALLDWTDRAEEATQVYGLKFTGYWNIVTHGLRDLDIFHPQLDNV